MTRTHVVTGAGAGIGLQLARRLSDRGDTLVLPVRSAERAAEVLAELGERHHAVVADLGDLEQVAAGAARIASQFDHLDSLVHCAGVVDLAPVATQGVEAWQHQIDVNLTAPVVLTRDLLPALRAARGTVLFVNSTSGIVANPHWGAYAASKHGLRGLADALRAEEAPHGVRVASVHPSRTATPMQERVHAQEERSYRAEEWMSADTVAATLLHVLDLPSDATITDLTIRTSPSPS